MRKAVGALVALAVVTLGVSMVAQQPAAPAPAAAAPAAPIPAGLPDWAYTPPPPAGSPPPPSALPAEDTARVSIPGTTKTFTRGELRAAKETMDWYPEDRHGTMPDIAKFGKQGVRQCTLCHLPDGSGRPENAPISAYHPTYFLQQMQDFRDGLRKSADPRKANTNVMIGFAKLTTREEDLAAAQYFAQQPYPRRIKVVESKTAPKVLLQGGMHMAVPASEGGGPVPLPAGEIVEIPDDNLRAEARDTRMPWTAYVPPGTLNRGKQLAAKYSCSTCHGANLEGIGPVPALAGRSPSYTMRQLFDMKTGARRGPWSELMKPIVTSMSVQDLAAVSAFAASTPAPAPRPATTTAAR
ncbi:MAG TPA: c-type cytochrome [Vicinamibacterales bacterium]|nr:c-type cytochrome [Vicinamibacterales bacterium]